MIVIRSLITVTLLTAFLLMWFWAWRGERRDDFAAAARMPLEEDTASPESKSP